MAQGDLPQRLRGRVRLEQGVAGIAPRGAPREGRQEAPERERPPGGAHHFEAWTKFSVACAQCTVFHHAST